MRQLAPVVFDGTHSVQQPSAANGVSGGQPEFIPLLARAAVAAGIDGLFLEVHDDPPMPSPTAPTPSTSSSSSPCSKRCWQFTRPVSSS